MSKITIEHNPTEERLQELGVSKWPTWEKEVSEFPIDFDETEVAYVLEGEILVTPAFGESVRIVPGDLVSFHAGLDSQWEVVKPLRKHYSYDFPDGVLASRLLPIARAAMRRSPFCWSRRLPHRRPLRRVQGV